MCMYAVAAHRSSSLSRSSFLAISHVTGPSFRVIAPDSSEASPAITCNALRSAKINETLRPSVDGLARRSQDEIQAHAHPAILQAKFGDDG